MISFNRLDETPLYLPNGSSNANPRSGFLFTTLPPTPATTFTLPQMWNFSQGQGAFIFFNLLPSNDSDLQQFITNLTTFIQQQKAQLAWLTDPLINPSTGFSLTGQMQGQRLVIEDTTLPFCTNFSLWFKQGSLITLDMEQNGFIIAGQTPDSSLWQINEPNSGGTSEVRIEGAVRLPLANAAGLEGTMNFNITPSGVEQDALGIGLRYFTNDLQNTNSVYYAHAPLFDNQSALPLTVNLDLLATLDHSRSFCTFSSGNYSITLQSMFRTTLDAPVLLTPQSNAQLVFNASPSSLLSTGSNSTLALYIAPAGDFKVALDLSNNMLSGTNTKYFMCGFSGVEYIDFAQTTGNILSFIPDQNAFSPAETDPDAPANNPAPILKPLTALAKTSWAYLRNPTATLWYHTQPDGAVFHTVANANDAYLSYMPIVGDGLQSTLPAGQEAEYTFPLVPFQGISLNMLPLAYQFEIQVLNPTRRDLIFQKRSNAGGATKRSGEVNVSSLQGVTPQGFQVSFSTDVDEEWQSFTLAQTENTTPSNLTLRSRSLVATPSNNTSLQINNIAGPLRAALQANQMFLVISSRSKFLSYASLPAGFFGLTVQSWSFDLNPDFWAQNETIWIFKRHSKSLRDLVQDTTSWNQPESFNDDVVSIQQRLQSILSDAQVKTQDTSLQSYFSKLLQVVDQETWNGVIIFNANLPPTAIPTELIGLATGMDAVRLSAHHLILNQTPVSQNGTQLAFSSNTSISAVINYRDMGPLLDNNTSYDFKVLSLDVLFDNSQITQFSSQICLMVNQLFGEKTSLTNSSIGGNNLVLNGVYQKRDSSNSYVFLNESINAFEMQSLVLNQIRVSRIQFVPAMVPSQVANGQATVQFNFSGSLDFKNLAGFDAFSFGVDDNNGVRGQLLFSNLFIDLRFQLQNPLYKSFDLDLAQIVLNPASSVARPGSLYSHFPLQLKTLIQGSQTGTPQTLGYLPVSTPLKTDGLSQSWFGMQFDLNMGSLGALAAKAGFVASLLIAWSPSSSRAVATAPRVFIGLKMPGVSIGQREINLENIIKLSFGNLSFEIDGTSYVLILGNARIQLLTLRIPPFGQTALVLFGDPRTSTNSTLGWYAAYSNNS